MASGRIPHSHVRQHTCRHPNDSHGFTLLELLVVMVIIGLLASYVGPKFFDQVGKSETKATKAQIVAFGKALDAYRLDTGHYPTTDQGLNALVTKPAGELKWSGPYMQASIPLDPWGNAYLYEMPGKDGQEFEIRSLGKDGKPGGAGDASDISTRDLGR